MNTGMDQPKKTVTAAFLHSAVRDSQHILVHYGHPLRGIYSIGPLDRIVQFEMTHVSTRIKYCPLR